MSRQLGVNRLEGLQILRGIAISSVVVFHVYVNLQLPDANWIAYSPLSFGFLGVQLFFMISGFVIFKSLTNEFSFSAFIAKRYLRLIPPLLLILPILILVSILVPSSPFKSSSSFSNLLPSLTLISPELLNLLTGKNFSNISGVMWSLNAEITFYVSAGLIFFLLKKRVYLFFWSFFVISSTIAIIHFLNYNFNNRYLLSADKIILITRIQNFPWFCIGIFLFMYISSGKKVIGKWKILILVILVIEGITARVNLLEFSMVHFFEIIYSVIVVLVFLKLGARAKVKPIFFSKKFLWLGNMSYEWYLIHYGTIVPVLLLFRSYVFRDFLFGEIIFSILLVVVSILCSNFIFQFGSKRLIRYLRSRVFREGTAF